MDIVDNAMYNTYQIVVGKRSEEEICKDEVYSFMEITDKTISMLLKYFEGTEEYEICSELVKFK